MASLPQFVVMRVRPSDVIDLRSRILRPEQPPETSIYLGDDSATTVHFGIRDEATGRLIACGTFLRDPLNGEPAWRLRGMAVDDTAQRGRLGSTLLTSAERELLTMNHARLFWCNARATAIGFYERLGWTKVGEMFVTDDRPHIVMTKRFE